MITDDHPVLVVDDDNGIREAICAILSDEGYPVVTAANGREALEWVQERTPSVILLDLMMPVMTGWEFFEHVRGDPRLGAIPICVLSAYAERAPAEAVAVLRKPPQIEWLLDVVGRFGGAGDPSG
jgi:CheY-like chemotaxis protein